MNKPYCTLASLPLVLSTFVVDIDRSSAELPPLIPRKILFGNPELRTPRLSPDGKYIAYLAPDKKNVMQVWIRSVDKQDSRMLTSDAGRGIQSYFWTYNSRYLVFQQDQNGNENSQLNVIDTKLEEVRNITPYQNIQAQMVALEPKYSDQILVAMNLKDPQRHDIYRINLKDGKTRLATEAISDNVVDAIADRQFNVRAAKTITPDGGSALLVRQAANKPWRTVRKSSPDDELDLVSFSADGNTLYVKDTSNANSLRLKAVNLNTDKETILAQDPQYDVGEVLVDPLKREIDAVSFQKEKLEWQVLDKSIAEDFAELAKARRGQYQVTSRDLNDRNWLVAYTTDDGPIYYHLYNRESKKSKFLFSNQSKLEGLSLAQKKPFSYKSRDGLDIHGYLTTPVGIPSKNLPTVLLVHGGPWERDTWGFNPAVQLLANRGYAVVQINFRGSSGYGKRFLNAGNREWGGKMHNDLIDGVNWAVKQGIADPKRIGITGSSYGGYATLAGLTFTPEVFAAGVAVAAPSNLITLLESIPPFLQPLKALYNNRVGNLEQEPDFLKLRSPLFFVERIQAPLLIIQGANDVRVTQAESEQIVAAMRKAKKPVEYVLFENEGHSIVRPGNRLHLIAKTEEFFGKHLGGRVEPVDEKIEHSGINK